MKQYTPRLWQFLIITLFMLAAFNIALWPAQSSTAQTSSDWCVAGSFQGWNNASHPLNDAGQDGDIFPNDGIYSLNFTIADTGRHEFKIVECGNWDIAYPSQNSWFFTNEVDQTVIFTFDSNDRSGDAGAMLTPSQNIVNVWGDDLPTSFTAVGSFQGWNNANLDTQMSHEGNGIYRLAYEIASSGTYEAKIVATGSWDEQFVLDGRASDGPGIFFTTTEPDQTVIFLLDSRRGRVVFTPRVDGSGSIPWCVAGEFNGWDNNDIQLNDDGLNGDLIGNDGVYSVDLTIANAGRSEFKVVECDNWSNTLPPGPNSWLFTGSNDQTVKITVDTNDRSADAGHPLVPNQNIINVWDSSDSFTVVGDFQGWNNANPDTLMTPIGQGWYLFNTPLAAGDYMGKVTRTGSWDAIGPDFRSVDAANVHFTMAANEELFVAYDSYDGRLTFLPRPLAVAPIQLTLSSPAQGQLFVEADILVAGNVTAASPATVTINLNDTDFYSPAVDPNGDFSQMVTLQAGANVIVVTAATDDDSVSVARNVTFSDVAGLVQPVVAHPVQDEIFYFLLPDRFRDGDPGNNYGDDPGGDDPEDILRHGYLPTDKGYYHGGDFAGLMQELNYIEGLGVTAVWLTPIYLNKPVQGDGTIAGSSSAYHGYWIVDYTQPDPHLGTHQELVDLIAELHSRGLKVYFDIVTNHTADVIDYAEGIYTYRNKTDYPYRDADGVPFDDRDYVGTGTFPELDPAISFPYTPVIPEGEEDIKNPAWLNNPIYYHNRGNSTFAGESSLYGDFFGLDDLFTEHPVVVQGMIDIFTQTVSTYDIDGFRIDTVKHVNDEFWHDFIPAIMDHAQAQGKEEFFMFGEVFDGSAEVLSYYTAEVGLPSVLDFGFHGNSHGFAVHSNPTQNLQGFFVADDYFTTASSNAYQLGNFISNHDIGRIGRSIQNSSPAAQWVNRSTLAHALMYFSRGFPVIYYGDEQGFTGGGGDKDARQNMFPSQVAEYDNFPLIGTNALYSDDNFDTTHPIYQALAEYGAVYQAHEALRRGAQIHRYGSSEAGIYAFSRIERDEQVEYVLAFNNSPDAQNASFAIYSPDTSFTAVYPPTNPPINSDANGEITVSVPGLSFVIYQAGQPIAASSSAPLPTFTTPAEGAELFGRSEIGVSLDRDSFVEVTFAVSVDGGDFIHIGTDDNAPYRVFYNVNRFPAGSELTFIAIVNDLHGNLSAATRTATVAAEAPPPEPTDLAYAIIHYLRDDGDYGDHTTGDFNDFWGLHLWGSAIDPDEVTDWTDPKPFLGETDYGRFAWIKMDNTNSPVNFIIHRGDTKDGTEADRFFDPAATPQIWVRQGDPNNYASQAEAQSYVTVRYHRPDGNYDGWGLYLWQDGGELVPWNDPHLPDEFDDYGAVFIIGTAQYPQLILTEPLYFIVKNDQDEKDPNLDRSFNPWQQASIWLKSADATIYDSRGHADNVVTFRYHRPAGDYGDYDSNDFNDFWGLHTWGAAADPGWATPRKPAFTDVFGVAFAVPIINNEPSVGYIFHRGDDKDPGPDQFLTMETHGYEVWQLQGADPENPYILPILIGPGASSGNIHQQRAYWLAESIIAWDVADNANLNYTLHFAPDGGLEATTEGIVGGDHITLVRDPAGLPADVQQKFPHLADLSVLRIGTADLPLVPEILRGQFAVSAVNNEGQSVNATGLQIPGVLDDLYTYEGDLGLVWDEGTPSIKLWAPTAQNVTFHLFDDSTTPSSSTVAMDFDAGNGVWSVSGAADWYGQYYLYEVQVYVPGTGQVEQNMVTDPYSVSLAMNSTRSQIVDLNDPTWQPAGWDGLAKPPLVGPQDISIYEIHVRDFSAFDETVPEHERGTFRAFTYDDTHGMSHLLNLANAGLTHLHLLPVFDIATINEDKSTWQEPDYELMASYPPDSPEQQAAIAAIADLDAFNWGYDPFHYNVPEGSYSTDPDGPTRILEFREMVQAVNEHGLRLVVDVVYNHTNAAGQGEKSVLDRIVPGYYHRLNNAGQVETSTCCPNTATEHNMMEKLMVDSVVLWATAYKVDAFRFDLMGHHMKDNMLAVRDALDALTLEEHGVDGSAIFLYGEGWNFGEVANNARGLNATQFNMAGTGIATFSDRQRDAVRGGGPFDSGEQLKLQGFANGLFYDPNDLAQPDALGRLLLYSDQIRVGMAGNLAGYQLIDRHGNLVTGADVPYHDSPAGYTEQPYEAITYISKHDNQTLYDINVYGMPFEATMEERIRAQIVGLSTVALGQGVPFFHAGSEMLRSKSLDRDSYNSGDWFNRLDFTYQHNNFGVGLPIAEKNQENWPLMVPYLSNPDLVAAEADITLTTALFEELLAIRTSSPLFRLGSADLVQERLAYHNTGPNQVPGLIVMSLSDLVGEPLDPNHKMILVLVNANSEDQTFSSTALAGHNLSLHPVQMNSVDEVVKTSTYDGATGTFFVPARTTVVFVEPLTPQERIDNLIADIDQLVADGELRQQFANRLYPPLHEAKLYLDAGQPAQAILQMNLFMQRVQQLVDQGRLAPAWGDYLIGEAEAIIAAIQNQ
jgi:pullulanase-type alpha-1,6-glucosidase